jgi:PPOX class probable F420-dependent enzyme
MPTADLQDSFRDLLERPLFAHLATVRPDGSPQPSVMWFAWDGERLLLSHTRTRQKVANVAAEPRVALSIADPEDPYRFLEVRGRVESVVDDDEKASFCKKLQARYGMD